MSSTRAPDISVIVPVHNERERLERNMSSLLKQINAPDHEIIYVDDHSTDGSWEKLLQLTADERSIRTYRLHERYPVGTVRALAVRLARGSIIANIDADCEAPPDWLAHFDLLEDGKSVVGFPTLPPSDLEYLHRKFVYTGSGQYRQGELPHGCGALMSKEMVMAAGNFQDVDFAEDTKLFRAMVKRGAEVKLRDRPTMRLLEKRTTLRQHLARYYHMGGNADSKARSLYSIALGLGAVSAVLAVILWGTVPVLAWLPVVFWVGILASPWRVSYYLRSFRLPRNRFAKVVYFTALKMMETLSLLTGFLVSLGADRQAGNSLSPTVLDEEASGSL